MHGRATRTTGRGLADHAPCPALPPSVAQVPLPLGFGGTLPNAALMRRLRQLKLPVHPDEEKKSKRSVMPVSGRRSPSQSVDSTDSHSPPPSPVPSEASEDLDGLSDSEGADMEKRRTRWRGEYIVRFQEAVKAIAKTVRRTSPRRSVGRRDGRTDGRTERRSGGRRCVSRDGCGVSTGVRDVRARGSAVCVRGVPADV